MSRQSGLRALAAAGLLVVVTVLGLSAKVGRDTSQYLRTVSMQRNWDSPGQGPEEVRAASSAAASEARRPVDSHRAAAAPLGVVASH